MAKEDTLEIATKIHNNHYKGENLLGENPTGKLMASTDLYEYNEDKGVWEEINQSIIQTSIVYEYEKRKRSEIADVMDMVKLLAVNKFLKIGKEFNYDKFRLVLENGVFNLKTGKLEDFDKNLLATNALPFKYDENADCPKFKAFLEQIFEGKQDMIDYTIEVMGYLFAPTTKYEAVFIWIGGGRNGKTTLEKIIKGLLGRENFCDIHVKDLVSKQSLVRMRNKLVNFSEENDESGKHPVVDTGILKLVSSGVEVVAEAKYKNQIEYVPFARQVIICNDLPRVTDTSGGWLRRLHIVPFNYTVPEDKVILDLDEQILEEASGIFNLAIEGYKRLEKRGRFELPQEVQDAVDRYAIDINSAAQFILEEVGIDNLPVSTEYGIFYAQYANWCADMHIGAYKNRTFYQNVERFCNAYKDKKIIFKEFRGTGNVKFINFTVKERKAPKTQEDILDVLDNQEE